MSTEKKLKLEVPANLHSITLGQYQKYLAILDKHRDEEGNVKEESTDFVNLKAVEIFCNANMKEIHQVPALMVDQIIAQLNTCFKEETPFYREIEIQGEDGKLMLGFIPNLEKMTYGEYVDLESYILDWQQMHKAMAVLYREIQVKKGEKYVIADYDGTEGKAEFMKMLPVGFAMAAQLFFYHLGDKLSTVTTSFLKEVGTYQLRSQGLLEDGDGTASSILSRVVTSLNSMPFPAFLSIKR